MFQELIKTGQEVVVYYGNHSDCICGTIKDYHEKFEVIQLDTHDFMLPLRCVTKIELVEPTFRSPLFKRHQVLKSDVDFDNAYLMALPISLWKNEKRLLEGSRLQRHDGDTFQICQQTYKKSEFTVKIS